MSTQATNSEASTDAPAGPPTPRHGEIVDLLRRELGDGLVEHAYAGTEAWVRVAPTAWREAARLCRDRLGLTYLGFISGIDWMRADLGGEKLWDPGAPPEEHDDAAGAESSRLVTGIAGGDTRFQVFARVADIIGPKVGLFLKVDAGDDHPQVESWVPVYRGADWHEREAWEMYGIEFTGHPGLRHLYLPGEFEGFPLRKDFPLLAREVKPWPGLVDVEPLPGEEPTAGEDGGAESGETEGDS